MSEKEINALPKRQTIVSYSSALYTASRNVSLGI